MRLTLAVGWACVLLVVAVYLVRSYQPTRLLKYIVSHPRDDPAFMEIRRGAADFCLCNGLTLDWVNLPVVEVNGLAYMDALESETKGFTSVACQCPSFVEGDLASHLSSDTRAVVQVRGFEDAVCLQPVAATVVGFDTAAMLQVALTAMTARPAIVSLPWTVDTSLGDGVTVERFSMENLLSRSRSDTIRTLILPDLSDFDYDKMRALFVNVKICTIGYRASPHAVDMSVWQDPYDIGFLSAALLYNIDKHDVSVGNIRLKIATKFFKPVA